MKKLPMSPAAAHLLRALLARAGIDRDRILLTDYRSTDWQSLTFIGERHEMELHVSGPGASELVENLLLGLGDAEFTIPGQIVADIVAAGEFPPQADGSVTLHFEALTIAE